MAKKVLTNLDLQWNELQKLRLENVSSNINTYLTSAVGNIAFNSSTTTSDTTRDAIKYKDSVGIKTIASREWVTAQNYLETNATIPAASITGQLSDGQIASAAKWNTAATDATQALNEIADAGQTLSTVETNHVNWSTAYNWVNTNGATVISNAACGKEVYDAINGTDDYQGDPEGFIQDTEGHLQDAKAASPTFHITSNERTNWNNAYKALFEADGSNAANVIDTWAEIKAFVADYKNDTTLASVIAGKTSKVTESKTFASTNSTTTWNVDITALGTQLVGVHVYEKTGSFPNEKFVEVLADVEIGTAQVSGKATYSAKITFATAPKSVTYQAVIIG